MDNNKPEGAVEIFLQPGEVYFGDRNTRIRTILGSCVAMVFWHPALLIGGMCHYMLPSRAYEQGSGIKVLDGRYADESLALIAHEMRVNATQPREYQLKIFGGGNMFPSICESSARHIGMKNVEAARHLIKSHRLVCIGEHLGDAGYRNVIFDIWSGDAWVRHGKVARDKISGREKTE